MAVGFITSAIKPVIFSIFWSISIESYSLIFPNIIDALNNKKIGRSHEPTLLNNNMTLEKLITFFFGSCPLSNNKQSVNSDRYLSSITVKRNFFCLLMTMK